MVLLTVRVRRGDATLLSVAGPHSGDERLEAVVNNLLSMDAVQGQAFELASVFVFADRKESPPGTELTISSLGAITVADIVDVGKFIVLIGKERQAAPRPQRDAFAVLGATIFVRPAKQAQKRYDWDIYNALIDLLDTAGLGFRKDEVDTLGKPLLLALKQLLQYALPFHDRGVFKVRHARLACSAPQAFRSPSSF